MNIAKKDIQQAVGSLQLLPGQDASEEATIDAMNDLFQQKETKAALLVDAENAFNSLNRKAILYNMSITCRMILTFV